MLALLLAVVDDDENRALGRHTNPGPIYTRRWGLFRGPSRFRDAFRMMTALGGKLEGPRSVRCGRHLEAVEAEVVLIHVPNIRGVVDDQHRDGTDLVAQGRTSDRSNGGGMRMAGSSIPV
jgi:hypothetical protein